jgi:hypothetical protein
MCLEWWVHLRQPSSATWDSLPLQVDGDLNIANNPALPALTGLNNIASVKLALVVNNNDALLNLAGLGGRPLLVSTPCRWRWGQRSLLLYVIKAEPGFRV